MSHNQGIEGEGRVRPEHLRALQARLIEAHNAFVDSHSRCSQGSRWRKLADDATEVSLLFPSEISAVDAFTCGGVRLDLASGSFTFKVTKNNHAVDESAASSPVYQALMAFIKAMPKNGSEYGAETREWSEHDPDEDVRHYGGWNHSQTTQAHG